MTTPKNMALLPSKFEGKDERWRVETLYLGM